MNGNTVFWKLDRILLAIYLIALIGLMMFPVSGPDHRYLGIGIDKWMHFFLFGGLAVFVRWNIHSNRYAVTSAIGGAFAVAVMTEIGQGLVRYRSAELMDLWAGLLGAALGAIVMNHIVSSPVPEKPIGILVGLLGVMVGGLFALADVIGVGSNALFGPTQMAGTALGIVITAGGILLYVKGLN